MSYTQVHRGLGAFTLELKRGGGVAGTPHSVLNQITPFSAVIFTPTYQGPAGTLSSSSLLANASFSGIVTGRSDERCVLEGQGPAVLLGDADGKGVTYTNPPANYTGDIGDWVTNKVIGSGRGNGVTEGTVSSDATSYTAQINPGDTPRAVLDFICDRAGMEWRVNPDFTLDVNTRASLFPTASAPTAVVRRGEGGRDVAIVGLPAQVTVESSWEDYTTAVWVKATTGAMGSASLSPSTSFYAPDGTRVEWVRYVDSNKAANASGASAVASAQLGRFDDARHEITLDLDLYHVDDSVRPGDTLYVYDPPNGLYDLSAQLYYRGETIFPTTLRAFAVTTPVVQGMGVYCRLSDSGGTLLDLTPFVVWESGPAEVEVGAVRRTVVVS